jgi:hypothetical protein
MRPTVDSARWADFPFQDDDIVITAAASVCLTYVLAKSSVVIFSRAVPRLDEVPLLFFRARGVKSGEISWPWPVMRWLAPRPRFATTEA